MRKRALSFITLLAILLSLGSINAFASPVMSGDIIVVDDNAGAIIQLTNSRMVLLPLRLH